MVEIKDVNVTVDIDLTMDGENVSVVKVDNVKVSGIDDSENIAAKLIEKKNASLSGSSTQTIIEKSDAGPELEKEELLTTVDKNKNILNIPEGIKNVGELTLKLANEKEEKINKYKNMSTEEIKNLNKDFFFSADEKEAIRANPNYNSLNDNEKDRFNGGKRKSQKNPRRRFRNGGKSIRRRRRSRRTNM